MPLPVRERLLHFAPRVEASVAEGSRQVLVTGAQGWFGSATMEMLDQALGDRFDRCVTAFGRTAAEVTLRSGRRVKLHPLASLADYASGGDDILLAHYAFATREKAASLGAETYIANNRALTAFMEVQGRRLGVAGTFSTSSGAVYTPDRRLDRSLDSNPYGALKLEEEEAFARLRSETGARTAICRVFNVAGPFLNKDYAIGSLILSALHDPVLTIRAQHRVYRSYAHIRDIVSIGFAVMLGVVPVPDAPYDTAGAETVEVGELAERVRTVLDCPGKPIERGALTPDRDDRSVGDRADFVRLAKAADLTLAGLAEQIADTAAFLASAR